MRKNLKNIIKKNFEIFGLAGLIIITALWTSYFNYKKNLKETTYHSFIDNVYFKKTLNHIVDNLDPKFKKVHHKIRTGETFDTILDLIQLKKKKLLKLKIL